jgi:hypothetical protein
LFPAVFCRLRTASLAGLGAHDLERTKTQAKLSPLGFATRNRGQVHHHPAGLVPFAGLSKKCRAVRQAAILRRRYRFSTVDGSNAKHS